MPGKSRRGAVGRDAVSGSVSGVRASAAAAAHQPVSVAWGWARARSLLSTLQDQRRLAWTLTLLLLVGDVLVVGQHVLVRHYAYHSYAFDLGNMDQAVWNTLHGHFFRFTNRGIDWYGPPIRLAIHVEPILLLIAPLYLLHSGADTLLVLQTLALALGALPVLGLALRRLPSAPLLGVVFAAAYLFTPELLGEALYDFHPVTLATPLLLAAILALDARRYRAFLVAGILAAACKEDVALALVPLGIYCALRQGRPRFGLLVAAGALVWTALCFVVIMPHFNHGISSGGNAYWYRYAALGSTPSAALRHLVSNPLLIVPVLFSPDKLGYLALLARTGGGLGIFAPLWWLGAAPELAINLLSSQPPQYSGFYHYNAITLPLLIAAAIAGTAALHDARMRAPHMAPANAGPGAGRGIEWASRQLDRRIVSWQGLLGRVPIAPRTILIGAAAWLLLCTGWNLVAIQPKLHGFWEGGSAPAPYQAQIDALLARIPASAVVAATDTLDPHLSDRETIYLMPDPQSYQAQYVAVDLRNVPSATQAADAVMFASMTSSHHYRVIGVAGSVVVLQRTGTPLTAAP